MKLVACSLALTLTACFSIPPRRATIGVSLAQPDTRITAPLAVAPLIDARPATLRRSHEPALSKYTGFALVAFAFGTGRTDGADHLGSDRIDITFKTLPGPLSQQLDLFVTAVLASAGASVSPAGAVDLGDVTRAAAGRPDGIVVIPILDQLDEFNMRSQDTMIGGGSSTSGNKTTVTSGFTSGTAKTQVYANLRLRLVLLDVRGGRIARQAVAYVATSGSALHDAFKSASNPMAAQVAAFATPP